MEISNSFFESLQIDVLSLEKINKLNEFNECLVELENKVYFYVRQCCDEYINKYVLSLFKNMKYVKMDDFNYKILYKNSEIGVINPLYKKLIVFNHNINKDKFDENYSNLIAIKYERIEQKKKYMNELSKNLTKPTIFIFFELLMYGITKCNFSPLKNIKQIKPNIMNTINELQQQIINESNLLERIKIKKEEFFKERLTTTKDFITHCEGLGLKTSYKNIDRFNVLNMIEDYINRYCICD